MITLYLHQLIPLDDKGEHWPDTFRKMLMSVEQQIDPRLIPEGLEDLDEAPKPVGLKPGKTEAVGKPFDRTPLSAAADWCKENEEPWLERALRFVVRHEDIVIERQHYYSETYRWHFKRETMPKSWRELDYAPTLAALFCFLAIEIKERIEQIGA